MVSEHHHLPKIYVTDCEITTMRRRALLASIGVAMTTVTTVVRPRYEIPHVQQSYSDGSEFIMPIPSLHTYSISKSRETGSWYTRPHISWRRQRTWIPASISMALSPSVIGKKRPATTRFVFAGTARKRSKSPFRSLRESPVQNVLSPTASTETTMPPPNTGTESGSISFLKRPVTKMGM